MLNRLIFIFSLLGFGVAAFLAYEYNFAASIDCPIGGSSCDTVRLSPYSSMFGISIPYYGVLYYFTMIVLSLSVSNSFKKEAVSKLKLLITIPAFLFGVYLTYLEAFVINAYCFWCVCSFIISAALLVLTFLQFKTTNKTNETI